MTTATDVQTLALGLASAKQPCPHSEDPPYLAGMTGQSDSAICSACMGTGEVYILGDSVRVEYGCIYGAGNHPHEKREHCDGRGWNPLDTRLGWDWMMALAKAGHAISPNYHSLDKWEAKSYNGRQMSYHYGDLKEAFFQAATKSLGLDTEEQASLSV